MTRRTQPLSLLLYGVNVLLLACIGVRVWHGSQRDVLLSATTDTPMITALDLSIPAIADFSALQAQAVFHKTRSFYVAPSAPAIEQAAPALRFAGSMMIPNQPPTAVLVNPQSGQRLKVRAGDQVEGWTVTEVSVRLVVLHLGERRAEISSSSGSAVTGMTVTAAATAPSPASGSGIRVLTGGGGATPGTASAVNMPSSGAPRLYRPPPRP